jgi:hypothetical protein
MRNISPTITTLTDIVGLEKFVEIDVDVEM